MKIKALGCMGGRIPGQELTGLLVDGELLLDAGSASASLTITEQNQIKFLLLSHAHLDHLYSLAFLLEHRLYADVQEPLKIFASSEAIEIVKNNFLIDEILNPAVIQNLERLVILSELETGKSYEIGKYKVEPVLVNHFSGAIGFFVSEGDRQFLFTADTGPSETLWEQLKARSECQLLITEVSFPNRLEEVARLSRHLTPLLLKEELTKAQIQNRMIYLYHLKPGYLDLLFQELSEIFEFDLHLLKLGMELDLDLLLKKTRGAEALQSESAVPRKVPKFDFGRDLYEQRQGIEREFGVSFEQGVIIFEEGELGRHLYIIQEGEVEIYRIILGKKKVLSMLGAGDIFGEMSVFFTQPRTNSARALTRVKAYAFDRNAFEQLVRENYGIALKVIRMLAQRLQEADIHIENLLYQDSESRLVNTIIRAVEDEAIETKDGYLLRLTPEQLAIRTDLRVEELKKLLTKLIRSGLVFFKEGFFSIPNLEELKKLLSYLELKQKFDPLEKLKL